MGKEITISKNSTFENSIIGDSCKIGASVKIENSVIFDHVKIDDG
jgi:NDP-sugar pyrophosphorylase family protein